MMTFNILKTFFLILKMNTIRLYVYNIILYTSALFTYQNSRFKAELHIDMYMNQIEDS